MLVFYVINAQIVDIEYPQRICLSIFVVEIFSGLFEHSFFLIKDFISAFHVSMAFCLTLCIE